MSFLNYRTLTALPVPVIGLTVVLVGTVGIGASLTFESQPVLSISQLLLVLLPSILVAYVSARSYLYTRSTNLLLLGTAVLGFGTSNLIGGVFADTSPLIAVAIFLIGGLVAAALHASSAILTLLHQATRRTHPRLKLIVSYSGVLLFYVLIVGIAAFLPSELLSLGSTSEQTIQAVTIVLFFTAAFVFYRVYSTNKNPVMYWYVLALFLTALANLAFLSTQSLWELVTWTGRVALYIASVYFIQAILKAKSLANGNSSPANYPELGPV